MTNLRSDRAQVALAAHIDLERRIRAAGGSASLLLVIPHSTSESVIIVDSGEIVPEDDGCHPGDTLASTLETWVVASEQYLCVPEATVGYWARHIDVSDSLVRLCDSMCIDYEHDGSSIVVIRIEPAAGDQGGLFVAEGGKPMKDLHTCTIADMIRAIGFYAEKAFRYRGRDL